MVEKETQQNLLFILYSVLIMFPVTIVTWTILALIISFTADLVFPGIRENGEGGFFILAIVFWATPILLGIGVILSYFISMRLAEYLRGQQGWALRYPRRLFTVSLLIPIILSALLVSLVKGF